MKLLLQLTIYHCGGVSVNIQKQVRTIEAIRTIRKARGMTVVDLAKAVGVSHVSVIQWERGTNCPQAEKLPAIADALGVSIDALYGREPILSQIGG